MKPVYRALIQLFITAFLWSLTHRFIPENWLFLKELIWISLLLGIGYTLSPKAKKNNRWVGKTVLSILLLMIIGIRFSYLSFPRFESFLSFWGLEGFFLDLFLIYIGWAFFQV